MVDLSIFFDYAFEFLNIKRTSKDMNALFTFFILCYYHIIIIEWFTIQWINSMPPENSLIEILLEYFVPIEMLHVLF